MAQKVKLRMRRSLPALLTMLLLSASTHAQWNSDPTINNKVSNVAGTKDELFALPDGAGGMHLVWTDSRNSGTTGTDIYYQRILNNGTLVFDSAGVLVCNAAGAQANARVVPAAAGAVIVVWQDGRTASNNAIYAQKISSTGTPEWAANGVVVADATGNQNSPQVVSDGAGGAIAFFQDNRVSGVELYAQRINGDGVVQWTADGIAIATQANSQNAQTIVADGAGNYYLAWSDGRIANSNSDVFVQKIDNSGTLAWNAANQGVNICNANNNQLTPQIALGAGGSIYVTWADLRAGTNNLTDVYVQRVLSDGTVDPAFPANGLLVGGAANNQTNPYIVADGSGNAIITWADQRAGTASTARDIFAQKVLSTGAVAWAANGVQVTTEAGAQPNSATEGFRIVSDGAGGAIIVWDDARISTTDLQVYAQRLDGDGNALWPVGPDPKAPIAVASGAANQRIPVAVTDGSNGVIVAWADSRSGTNLDLFASRVFAGGALPVSLLRFDASANGSQALLQWETAFESNIKAYAVERSADGRRFEQIGKLSAANATSARYQFTDRQPLSGANYYRLQTLELDGSSSLSRVLKLNFAPRSSGVLRLWPNPIKDRLNLELTNLNNGTYQVRAIDASGRITSQTVVQVANGQLSQSLTAGQLPMGLFTLQVVDASGKTVAQEKVMRQ